MTRNPIHVKADKDLAEYLQYWFDGLKEGQAVIGWLSYGHYVEDCIDAVCRGRSLEVEIDDYEERRHAAQDGSKPELSNVSPDDEREEYTWETFGELQPAQVLEVLAEHGFPVNTYGFSSEVKELSRLPG